MELIKPFWDGVRWHEAGEKCPYGKEDVAQAQGALPAPAPAQEEGKADDKTVKPTPTQPKTEAPKA